jgi:uncharacterized membrane protein (UPF0127 family)
VPTVFYALRDVTNDVLLSARVRRAAGSWMRTVGFLTHAHIAADEGMWFEPCDAVHTLGMRSALDIVFLDDEQRVVRCTAGVPPWRPYVGGGADARITVEFGPGFLALNPIAVGVRLALEAV